MGVAFEIPTNRCKYCNCHENDACVVMTPEGPKPCYWVDEEKTTCSACAMQMMERRNAKMNTFARVLDASICGLCSNTTILNLKNKTCDVGQVADISVRLAHALTEKLVPGDLPLYKDREKDDDEEDKDGN